MCNQVRRNHVFAILLWLAAVVLCVLALPAPLANLAISGPRDNLFVEPPIKIMPVRTQSSPLMAAVSEIGGIPKACLAITLRQLQPGDGVVAAAIRFAYPDAIRRLLEDNTGEPVYEEESSSPFKSLKPEYADEQIRISFTDRDSSSTERIFIPMTTIFDDIGLNNPEHPEDCQVWADNPWSTPTFEVKLHVNGRPDLYPNDWYSSRIEVIYRLGDRGGQYPLYFVGAGTGVAAYEVLAGEEKDRLSLLIQREFKDVAYIYAIASVPLGLLFILIHLIIVSGKADDKDEMGPFLIGVAAAMLAVLPLRQVLVPSDIPGITRTDMYLGLQLVLIVCAALVGYGRHVWTTLAAPIGGRKKSDRG